ncbi:MAG: 6-phosphofructokinase [Chloroflexi bacterium]|nr:6-phosphofructokinase [Chloroflexota bacterium]
MRRVAVLTSGGDAPGMNAAIRAVARTGIDRHWTIVGVRRGYAGLMSGDFVPLGARDVGGIIHQPGTFLRSARAPEFKTEEGRERALFHLNREKIDGLVVIGGNGSQTGAAALSNLGVPVVGIASTIDNDLYGSDISIGVDTALNIGLEAIDRLRATASSHERAFLIELMGRDCGYLALIAAIAGGAEAVVIPEVAADPDSVVRELQDAHRRGKSHGLVVVAEGAEYNADAIARHVIGHQDRIGFELRVTKLGHVQRGGIPSVADRLLATRLAAGAVEQLARGETGTLVGLRAGEVAATPLAEVANRKKELDPALLEFARILAR